MFKRTWIGPAKKLHGTIETIAGAAYFPMALALRTQQQRVVVDAGEDRSNYRKGRVRLVGYFDRSSIPTKQLVVLLHGWEGSSHTSDIVSLASSLIQSGYDCFRLNFRDHGGTSDLNPGFFSGALLDEVVFALASIKKQYRPEKMFVVGHSLGGNFGIRAAAHGRANELGLSAVIAVCPPLEPSKVVTAIDQSLVFREYFLRSWRQTLKQKQKHFPDIYDFSEAMKQKSIYGLTEWIRSHYTDYKCINEYFSQYRITRTTVESTTTTIKIIAAKNDPVIPANDFQDLAHHPNIELKVLPTGGHLGFAEYFPVYRRKLSNIVLESLEHIL